MGSAMDEDPIAVDPPARDEIYIVIDDIAVYAVEQLPIADIRHKVRLHDAEFHLPCSICDSFI